MPRRLLITLAFLAFAISRAGGQRSYDSAGVWINDQRQTASTPRALRLEVLKEFAGGPDSSAMTAWSTAMLRLSDGRFAIGVNPPRTPPPPVGSPVSAFRLPPDAPPPRTTIRLYDSTGRFIRNIGKAGPTGGGRGGGQFSSEIRTLREIAGSRIVAGQLSYRWAVFNDQGDVLYASRLGPQSVYGAFSDGSVLLGLRGVEAGSDIRVGGAHFVIGTFSFSTMDPVVLSQKDLGIRTRNPSQYLPPPDGDGRSRISSVSYPVAASPVAVLGGDLVWTVDAMRWEARAYDQRGRLMTIIRMPVPANALNARYGRPVPFDSLRTYRIAADDGGRLWIDGGSAGQSVTWRQNFSRDWKVYDRDGRLAHVVTMPEGFFPFHFGRDFILGRRGEVAVLYALR